MRHRRAIDSVPATGRHAQLAQRNIELPSRSCHHVGACFHYATRTVLGLGNNAQGDIPGMDHKYRVAYPLDGGSVVSAQTWKSIDTG